MNVLIAMSGGTTTVINATLAGLIVELKKMAIIDKIYAADHGIQGLMNNKLIDLSSIRESEIEDLYHTPTSSFIGTSRTRTLEEAELLTLERVLNENSIQVFFNIGGNGTLQQSKSLSRFFGNKMKIIFLPKTVDNDLGDSTFSNMYCSPGFMSCINYWQHKINLMNHENIGAFQHDKVLVLQTFGRDTGFIAGSVRAADPKRKLPLMILLPEDVQSINKFLNRVKDLINSFNRALIVVAEGYPMFDLGYRYDKTGQIMYSSSQKLIAQEIVNILFENNIQARAFIPGIDQRDEILLSNKRDLEIAYKIGEFAVKMIETSHNFMVGIKYDKLQKKLVPVIISLNKIGNYSRHLPSKWISKGKFDVTDDFLKYISPLLARNQDLYYKKFSFIKGSIFDD